MSKREDAMIAKLIKKATSKTAPPKDRSKQYDDTLRVRGENEDSGSNKVFKEMKRREF